MEVVAMDVDLESHEPKGNHPLTLGWDDESEGCAWNLLYTLPSEHIF